MKKKKKEKEKKEGGVYGGTEKHGIIIIEYCFEVTET